MFWERFLQPVLLFSLKKHIHPSGVIVKSLIRPFYSVRFPIFSNCLRSFLHQKVGRWYGNLPANPFSTGIRAREEGFLGLIHRDKNKEACWISTSKKALLHRAYDAVILNEVEEVSKYKNANN